MVYLCREHLKLKNKNYESKISRSPFEAEGTQRES